MNLSFNVSIGPKLLAFGGMLVGGSLTFGFTSLRSALERRRQRIRIGGALLQELAWVFTILDEVGGMKEPTSVNLPLQTPILDSIYSHLSTFDPHVAQRIVGTKNSIDRLKWLLAETHENGANLIGDLDETFLQMARGAMWEIQETVKALEKAGIKFNVKNDADAYRAEKASELITNIVLSDGPDAGAPAFVEFKRSLPGGSEFQKIETAAADPTAREEVRRIERGWRLEAFNRYVRAHGFESDASDEPSSGRLDID